MQAILVTSMVYAIFFTNPRAHSVVVVVAHLSSPLPLRLPLPRPRLHEPRFGGFGWLVLSGVAAALDVGSVDGAWCEERGWVFFGLR
jgi:hypothetical protein